VGGGGDYYDAQLSLEGDDLAEVVTAALGVFAKARAAVGLPAWPCVELEAKTEALLDSELSKPPFPEVVGATEAARMLGVSRQRLYQLAERVDFPPPMVQLAAGPCGSPTASAPSRGAGTAGRDGGHGPGELM
jgi:hypothetical protein